MNGGRQGRGGGLGIGHGASMDEVRSARAALSRLFEPADAMGRILVDTLGPVDALAVATGRLPAGEAAASLPTGPAGRTDGSAALSVALERWRPRVTQLAPERDIETIARFGGRLVTPEDPEWPSGLADLGPSEPLCLWVRGEERLPELQSSAAVVGSRDATSYGISAAGELAKGLADKGIAIVSGGAYGIDGQAHRAALASATPSVPTVAVMACGVDRYYPSGNEELLREVARRGLMVSELPPGAHPTKRRFLERNRLIAALSAVTVVVEARWRSGALSTARRAADLGRHVAAVPGSIFSANSAGCHRLLRDGAACVVDAAEVYELMAPAGEGLAAEREIPPAPQDNLSLVDLMVLDALPVRRGSEVEVLAAVAGLSQAEVRAGLGRLSLLGYCVRTDGGWRKTARA